MHGKDMSPGLYAMRHSSIEHRFKRRSREFGMEYFSCNDDLEVADACALVHDIVHGEEVDGLKEEDDDGFALDKVGQRE